MAERLRLLREEIERTAPDDARLVELHADLATAEFAVALANGATERMERLAESLGTIAQILSATLGREAPRAAMTQVNWALARFELALLRDRPDRAERAASALADAVADLRRGLPAAHLDVLTATANLGVTRLELARTRASGEELAEAVATLRTARTETVGALGPSHEQSLLALGSLASAELDLAAHSPTPENVGQALGVLNTAVLRLTRELGAGHPETRIARRELRSCEAIRDGAVLPWPASGYLTSAETALRHTTAFKHPGVRQAAQEPRPEAAALQAQPSFAEELRSLVGLGPAIRVGTRVLATTQAHRLRAAHPQLQTAYHGTRPAGNLQTRPPGDPQAPPAGDPRVRPMGGPQAPPAGDPRVRPLGGPQARALPAPASTATALHPPRANPGAPVWPGAAREAGPRRAGGTLRSVAALSDRSTAWKGTPPLAPGPPQPSQPTQPTEPRD